MRRWKQALLMPWTGGANPLAYTNKVIALSPLAYYPLAEPSGTTVVDESGNGRNGTYSNITLGATGIGDGRTSATFNGTTSLANIFSAGLAAAINGSEGTLAVWGKVSGAGIWTDGAVHRLARIFVDSNNDVSLYKDSTNNRLVGFYRAGGTIKTRNVDSISTTGWFHLAIVWSKAGDFVRIYYNGVQQGADLTSLGVWAGTPTIITIGAATAVPANVWSGDEAHVPIFTTPLSSAQVLSLATV